MLRSVCESGSRPRWRRCTRVQGGVSSSCVASSARRPRIRLAEDVEFLVPWLLLEDARAAMETRRQAEFERALAAAEAKAELQGNLRVLAVASNFRGNGKAMERDADGAALHYAASCERFTRLGDRLERTLATDMRAFVEVKRERLDAAEEFLLEGEALCAERGMDAVEDALLQTRFQLAVARSDGPAAAAIAAEIQRRKDRRSNSTPGSWLLARSCARPKRSGGRRGADARGS
jgi:hypothetical protein